MVTDREAHLTRPWTEKKEDREEKEIRNVVVSQGGRREDGMKRKICWSLEGTNATE